MRDTDTTDTDIPLAPCDSVQYSLHTIGHICYNRSFFNQHATTLELGISWISGEGNHIPNVIYSRAVLHKPLEP